MDSVEEVRVDDPVSVDEVNGDVDVVWGSVVEDISGVKDVDDIVEAELRGFGVVV